MILTQRVKLSTDQLLIRRHSAEREKEEVTPDIENITLKNFFPLTSLRESGEGFPCSTAQTEPM